MRESDGLERSETTPELSMIQKWFYAVVTHPGGVEAGASSADAIEIAPMSREGLERMITRSRRVSARDRLAIYGNAYFARLVECLSDIYPVVNKAMSEEAFASFAFDYLQRYPSRSYTLSRLGENFPRYLRETRPKREERAAPESILPADWPDFLIELAELEWTIAEVFDGPGLERESPLPSSVLGAIAPARWPGMRLRVNPALRLLAHRYPVNTYYTAARRSAEPVRVPVPAESFVAINRRDYVVRRHELSRTQHELLTALKEGLTIGESLERAAWPVKVDDDALAREVHHWFRDWSQYQFFAGVELT